MSTVYLMSDKLGPLNTWACPHCDNSLDQGVPADRPDLLLCAACKQTFLPGRLSDELQLFFQGVRDNLYCLIDLLGAVPEGEAGYDDRVKARQLFKFAEHYLRYVGPPCGQSGVVPVRPATDGAPG